MSSPRTRPKRPVPTPAERAELGTGASTPLAGLRLAIGRGGIAVELDDDVPLGPLRLVDLSIRLPGLPFPLDVSGGVARFRHRRGQLSRLEIDVDGETLGPHLARAFRGLLAPETPQVWLAVEPWGARVAVRPAVGPLARAPRPVLAFDLVVDAGASAVRLHVMRARGVDLPGPARQLALRAVDAATHRLAIRDGGRLALDGLPEQVTATLLPELGVRMPSIDSMQFAWFATGRRSGSLVVSQDPSPEPHEQVLRARELHELHTRIDDALLGGDLSDARFRALEALEHAPHEPALLHLVADLDRHAGGRAEAALATLARAPRSSRPLDGGLTGTLHEEGGDLPAALATFTLAAERDDVSWLGAACFSRAARLCDQPFDALDWLDRALVRDPTDSALHGARIGVAFAAGRPSEARASVEHLDAMLTGAEVKHEVWVAAGRAAAERGFGGEAIAFYECALARVPDAPLALAGLGSTMLAERRIARGISLLHRALERAEETGLDTSPIALALAKALADGLDNLPGAIARVRRIPSASEECIEARLLEGRWRAALGDVLGASVAFAHFREIARARVVSDSRIRGDLVAAGLLEAARFERQTHHDALSAHAHASIGLELRPTDPTLRAFYRHISAELAFPTGLPPERAPAARDDSWSAGPPPPAPDGDAEFSPLASELEPRGHRSAQGDGADRRAPPSEAVPTMDVAREHARMPPDADPIEHSPDAAALENLGTAIDLSLADDDEPVDAALEQRAAELTQRLQLDPSDDAVADALVEVLTTLDRGHELLALLLARLEDAPEERKPALRERTRAVLALLADRADGCGRHDEAGLFRMTGDALA